MKNHEIRQKFFDFFESKNHRIIASSPMIVKNDPTLMFTNAGMNQFKDYFLGNMQAEHKRVANTQKCLRVSGKHNDLEEVGYDTYHHTMFEMLGNWSFGDYFKKEAIEWAWELLTKVYQIDQTRLYATCFGGDKEENLEADDDAFSYWKNILPPERILPGSKKDNFWEMGDTGPCGPCSEIHIDLREDVELQKQPGRELVNKDHPQVIEIWNLVFIQFNRLSNGKLESLPQKHVDTGMGFERLCRVIQGVKSNYDTDIFQPIIQEIAALSGFKYGASEKTDIAMRVIADHLRAIAFSIADGQLPSNNKAGYVIRRILRRAVRYAFTFLDQKEAFIFKIVPALVRVLGKQFSELEKQQELISKVIKEEENAFLKTLETGIRMLQQITRDAQIKKNKEIDGKTAFELYDTYGFPPDLTDLILGEQGMNLNIDEFNAELQKQKERSRLAANLEKDDWVLVNDGAADTEFVGYDQTESVISISKYRRVVEKSTAYFQLIFDVTPFYAESGGQTGDTGYIACQGEKVEIIDTKKENNLIIHLSKTLPAEVNQKFTAIVDVSKRKDTMRNHSATHLLHHALRNVLGSHVEQKGSLVDHERTRFDFSHFQKVSQEELFAIEHFVNEMIIANLSLEEQRNISIKKAQEMGAIALFGEKYGEHVRIIRFGDSLELCGGTHVKASGEIGLFKIISESTIAAGIRRIEAITGRAALEYIQKQEMTINQIAERLSVGGNSILSAIDKLIADNKLVVKELSKLQHEKISIIRKELITESEQHSDIQMLFKKVDLDSEAIIKDLIFDINKHLERSVIVLAAKIDGKAKLWVMISTQLVDEKGLNAIEIIKYISKEIQGGGGGQAFFATAGGKNPEGIDQALQKAKEFVLN